MIILGQDGTRCFDVCGWIRWSEANTRRTLKNRIRTMNQCVDMAGRQEFRYLLGRLKEPLVIWQAFKPHNVLPCR